MVAFLIGFTKETSWVFIGGYCIASLLYFLFSSQGSFREKLRKIAFDSQSLSLLCACVIGLASLLFLALVGKLWVPGDANYQIPSDIDIETTEYNTFGVDWGFISTRFSQVFLLNFSWLLLVAAAIFLVRKIYLIRNSSLFRNTTPKTNPIKPYLRSDSSGASSFFVRRVLWSTFGGLALFMLFFAFYLNACEPRYICIASCAFYILVIFYFGLSCCGQVKLSFVGPAAFLAFCCVQAFYPIDPVSNAVFEKVCVGDMPILQVGQPNYESPTGMDYYSTNCQFVAQGKAMQLLFQESNYSSDDVVIMAGNSYQECERNVMLNDCAGRNIDGHRAKGWDSTSKCYRNAYCDENIDINTINTSDLFSMSHNPTSDRTEEDLYEETLNNINELSNGRYLVFFDPLVGIDEDEELTTLSQYFEIGERQSVEFMGWSISYYELFPKPVQSAASLPGTLFDAADISASQFTTSNGNVLYDPSTAISNEQVSDSELSSALLSEFSSYIVDLDDSSRTEIRFGDQVYCRIRYFSDGEWIPNENTPTGLNTQLVSVGSIYDQGIGISLIGQNIGTVITIQLDDSPTANFFFGNYEYDKLSVEIIPTKIKSGLSEPIELLVAEKYGITVDDYLSQLSSYIGHENVSMDEFLSYCVANSDYQPSQQEIESHLSDFENLFSTQADTLNLTEEEYLLCWVGISEEQFLSSSYEYAEYKAIEEHILDEYSKAGINLELYFS